MTAPRFTPAVLETRTAGVRQAIASAAGRTGVDFSYLLAQAKSESGLDPGAQARNSSAGGLFQFIDQSWLGILKLHGAEHGYGWAADSIHFSHGRWRVDDPATKQAIFALRKDATASALMAGEYAGDNADGLQKALGRAPSGTDLYFAHFLGLKKATRYLKAVAASPDASAASLFPREAAVNRGIFYRKSGEARSIAQVYALMGRKLRTDDGNTFGAPVQMAGDPQPDQVRLVDVPASSANGTATALADRGDRMSIFRPDPQHAMLAYRLIAASLSV